MLRSLNRTIFSCYYLVIMSRCIISSISSLSLKVRSAQHAPLKPLLSARQNRPGNRPSSVRKSTLNAKLIKSDLTCNNFAIFFLFRQAEATIKDLYALKLAPKIVAFFILTNILQKKNYFYANSMLKSLNPTSILAFYAILWLRNPKNSTYTYYIYNNSASNRNMPLSSSSRDKNSKKNGERKMKRQPLLVNWC